MDFTKTSEEQEANVYLDIPGDALSQRNDNATARSDSAITRAEFAEKLASMTDEDFSRQFQVIGCFEGNCYSCNNVHVTVMLRSSPSSLKLPSKM